MITISISTSLYYHFRVEPAINPEADDWLLARDMRRSDKLEDVFDVLTCGVHGMHEKFATYLTFR